MTTYRGIEVWLEDAQHRRLDHQRVSIDLVNSDDPTVVFRTEMYRDEVYSVHCRSPMSVLCDVYVTTASRVRKCAARFFLDKTLAPSKDVSGSSTGHTIGHYKTHGLRTPMRQFQHGKLGNVDVEIRRIDEIIKGESRGYEADGVEGGVMDFVMIDRPDQPPWLVFQFDICVKELHAVQPGAEHGARKRASHQMLVDQGPPGASGIQGLSPHETAFEYSKKRRLQHDAHDNTVPNTNLDLLQQEYQKEHDEEQRLVQKLQEQLEAKKARNMELRQMLGETA